MPDQRAIILSAAKDFVRRHVPYLWGGASTTATDCSGLTLQCYRAAGIELGRTTWDQAEQVRKVSEDEALPGDLVFFVIDSPDDHVGIYVGDHQMINAPDENLLVCQEHIWTNDHWFGRHPALDATPAQAPTGPLLQVGTLVRVDADEGLRLRSQPSINSLLLTTLADQTAVFVGPIQQVADGRRWRQVAAMVTVGDANTLLVGYVAEEYLV